MVPATREPEHPWTLGYWHSWDPPKEMSVESTLAVSGWNSLFPESTMAETHTTLSDGTQVYPEHREIDPKIGTQQGYVVLPEEEREFACFPNLP
jgi:hypothetical protein